MKLVVGLGNPGSQYENTRHNLGYMVLDELAARHQISLQQEKFSAFFGTGRIRGCKVVLAKPTTFMNRSGQAVLAIGQFYQLEYEDLMVITDDLALPTGKLRIRAQGSPGGHNGLSDITNRLGSDAWPRLRIGIGSSAMDASAYVLSAIGPDEAPHIRQAVTRAADAVECWLEHDIATAMNRYNPDPDSNRTSKKQKSPDNKGHELEDKS